MMAQISQFVFIFFIIATLFLPGCGRKTLPIPPHAVIPKAIKNLKFHQDESRVVLSWNYPEQTTIGTEIENIEGFEILRAVVPIADYCETCPVKYSAAVELDFDQAVIDRKSREAQFAETILRPGHQYIYKVRTKSGWRMVSDDSNEISFAWESPALAPTGVKLIVGDKSVTLSWSEVNSLVDGEDVYGSLLYQVLRSDNGKRFTQVGDLVSGLEFRDAGLVNGRKFDYKVRAVKQSQKTRVYGISSHVVSGTPKDLTPPVPPKNLKVVKVDGGLKLMWDRGNEKDIAGYKIYRRNSSGQDRALIGENAGTNLYYVDKKVEEDSNSLLYSITAYDRSQPPNESLLSKEVKYEPF